jgi:hypothetical protein
LGAKRESILSEAEGKIAFGIARGMGCPALTT